VAWSAPLEQQWSNEYLNGPPSDDSLYDFLLGDWETTRRMYDENEAVIKRSTGEMHAQYVLEGRVIQEGDKGVHAQSLPQHQQ
jgi:hypothetical protein